MQSRPKMISRWVVLEQKHHYPRDRHLYYIEVRGNRVKFFSFFSDFRVGVKIFQVSVLRKIQKIGIFLKLLRICGECHWYAILKIEGFSPIYFTTFICLKVFCRIIFRTHIIDLFPSNKFLFLNLQYT